LDVALIRQLAQPQADASPAPAAELAPVDVPSAAEPTGVMETAGMAGDPAVSAVAAPVPSGAPMATRSDRPFGQPVPLDRRVIASLASGDMGSVRKESEPVTARETATPALPRTQLELIRGVFAPEMQD
jgi:hypothetical protein